MVSQFLNYVSDLTANSFRVNLEQEDAENAQMEQTTLLDSDVMNFTKLDVTVRANDTDTDFWHFSRQTSIIIYSVIIGALIIITLVRSITFFSVCMRASTRLHDNMFASITRATMRFFNTNSAGRILNRFSKDMGSIDELLTSAMIDCLQIGLALLGIIIVVAIVSPWLMIPTVIAGIIFYFLRIFYIRTSRNVKRLEGISKCFKSDQISVIKLFNLQPEVPFFHI